MASTSRTKASTSKVSIEEVASPEVWKAPVEEPNVILYFNNFPPWEWNIRVLRHLLKLWDKDADVCVLYEDWLLRKGDYWQHCDAIVPSVESFETPFSFRSCISGQVHFVDLEYEFIRV